MTGVPARLTARFVAQALGLSPPSGPDAEFTAVSTDSRTLPEGALFVPIRGERFDGHDFIPAALARGAWGVVTSRPVEAAAPGVAVFAVPDTLAAFRTLAAAWRREFHIPVAVVAGSVGKTTTKDLLAAALSGRWRVFKTEASRNGDVGIPMTLLGLRPEHEAAVVEIGIDEVGAMARHLEIVRPTAAVVTTIAEEHLEKLGDLETVAREESLALSRVAGEGGLAAVNLDDPFLAPLFAKLAGPSTLGFSLEPGSGQDRVIRGRISEAFDELHVRGEVFHLPLPGAHNAANLLAAIAVAEGLVVSPDQIRAGLASFRPGPGRSEVRRLLDGTVVLCDWYNANPASTEAALTLFSQLSGAGSRARRVVCLGDMLELGPGEERFHRELAGPIERAGAHTVLLAGTRMRALAEELSRRGFSGRVSLYPSSEALASAAPSAVSSGDVVLVKGSRAMRMERVWDRLSSHP